MLFSIFEGKATEALRGEVTCRKSQSKSPSTSNSTGINCGKELEDLIYPFLQVI